MHRLLEYSTTNFRNPDRNPASNIQNSANLTSDTSLDITDLILLLVLVIIGFLSVLNII